MASIAEGNTDNTINPNKTAEDMTSTWNKWKAKGEELANKANAEKNKLAQEASEYSAQQQEKAKSRWGNLKGKWSEQTANAKAMVNEKRAQFEEYKASNKGKSLDQKLTEGTEGLKETAGNLYQKGKDGYEAAGQAKDVAKEEAARVHAETSAGILAGTEEESTGGMEANTPMQNSSGAYTVGGRRRRRKSRKKKKKSKRKSRRKKTRKRKSRKSRKKRRKKSKKSRRRRRR